MSIYKNVLDKLIENNMKISFVESCTGGMLVSTLVSIPGASKVLEESYITYSESAKKKIVGVKQETLDKYTVYSKNVAKEMAEGLYKVTSSNVCVAITGECGNGNTFEGTAYLCILINSKVINYVLNECGTREEIRQKYVEKVYEILLKSL